MGLLDDFAEALDAAVQLKVATDYVHQAAVDRLTGKAIDSAACKAASERIPFLAARYVEAERKAGVALHGEEKNGSQ